MQNALAECLKLAKPISAKEIKEAPKQAILIDKTIKRAQHKLSDLFGFEEAAAPAIEARISDLQREKAGLKNVGKYRGFRRLSLEPLHWRDKKTGYPLLVMLGLDSPRFELAVRGKRTNRYSYYGDLRGRSLKWSVSSTPKLPPALLDCYKDVTDKLREKAKGNKKSISLLTEYAGMIPKSTRQKIDEAEKLFDGIYIIAEGKNFELVETKIKAAPKPNDGDPIVVGFDGTNLWVIDTFDLTPIERFVASEFAI